MGQKGGMIWNSGNHEEGLGRRDLEGRKAGRGKDGAEGRDDLELRKSRRGIG